jgi:hypothetical protein
MGEALIIIAVIASLAVVQSLFGIGLLVFGTPTLLLLGYSFPETLAVLLPASLAVSLLQIWSGGGQDGAVAREFAVYCLLPLVLSLALVLVLELHATLNFAVALILATFAGLRLWPSVGRRARHWLVDHRREWLVLMGIVHGFSNLGGGLLTIFATAQHQKKEDIRNLIAFCYSCFAGIQLCILALFSPRLFGWEQLGYASVAAAIFALLGQPIFRWVSAPVFDRLLTALIVGYAGLLAGRAIGWP